MGDSHSFPSSHGTLSLISINRLAMTPHNTDAQHSATDGTRLAAPIEEDISLHISRRRQVEAGFLIAAIAAFSSSADYNSYKARASRWLKGHGPAGGVVLSMMQSRRRARERKTRGYGNSAVQKRKGRSRVRLDPVADYSPALLRANCIELPIRSSTVDVRQHQQGRFPARGIFRSGACRYISLLCFCRDCACHQRTP